MEVRATRDRYRRERLAARDGRRAPGGQAPVEVVATPTKQAMNLLSKDPNTTNAVLHVTC